MDEHRRSPLRPWRCVCGNRWTCGFYLLHLDTLRANTPARPAGAVSTDRRGLERGQTGLGAR
jgi:hypothetical protein